MTNIINRREVVEPCPHCGADNIYYNIDPVENHYKTTCKKCGMEMMLCDECSHADDYSGCDWHEEKINIRAIDFSFGKCFRGITTDKKLEDLNPLTKMEIIKHGYCFDTFINDECIWVRAELAKHGFGLDILINDDDHMVRGAVAEYGYGLDKLVNDESWNVRELVASQGYGLDKLINDDEYYVRCTARKHLGKPTKE